ncbi:MAG: septum formation protein Maf [Candidatus Jacksonbacteria bacterium]|nr:septum formation protein Maf [Candidatus Jacksonbacteria bacterium]
MKSLILASQSEGRRKLLEEAGYVFEVCVSNFDENSIKDDDPAQLVQKLSLAKARVAASRIKQDAVILAGDQVVVIGDKIVGKPKGADELRSWLLQLQNSYADVVQGYAVIDTTTNKEIVGVDKARVYFKEIPQEEINEWIAMDVPYKRAGGFSMQTPPSSHWIDRITGERSTVIGMPMHVVAPILNKLLLRKFKI